MRRCKREKQINLASKLLVIFRAERKAAERQTPIEPLLSAECIDGLERDYHKACGQLREPGVNYDDPSGTSRIRNELGKLNEKVGV